ncbi:MAG: PAS domain-containing protein, partial [Actinobacteria bacterium]|nr:PAS domain-containing protein [Actinomycetota bacterium]
DLVITDYHLPWTDGVEVLRAVKERWPDCPVVMFTGTGSEEIAVEAMKLGLDDYVLKSPQHLNGLSAAIRSALEQRDRRAVAREAADATKRTLSLLQATLDSTADGLLVVDREGRIAAYNRRFAEMWRIPQEILSSGDDQAALAFVLDQLKDPAAFIAKVGELYARPEVESFDVLEFEDGRVFERYSVPQWLEGEPVGRVWSFRDVTQRNRVETELRQAEDKYRTLVERIPAIVYFAEFGTPAPWIYISPRVESILGFPPEDWIADPALWMRQVHPDDLPRVMDEEDWARDTGVPFVSEYRLLARDGRVVWVRDEADVVEDESGNPSHLRGVMYDITERKRAEEELRQSLELLRKTDEERRALLSRLVQAQEDERARIAEDIHDDSIQVMTAVSFRLETMRRRLSLPDEAEAIEKLREAVESAIGRLRHLMFELRPRALDEDGLAAALRLYLGQLCDGTGIHYSLDNRLVEEPPQEARIMLYRIAQEALANARKHARAENLDVTLAQQDGGFLVRIRDDGTGFERPEADRSPAGHLGLTSMRERAEMAGGWWRVESTPGVGTIVEFWIP